MYVLMFVDQLYSEMERLKKIQREDSDRIQLLSQQLRDLPEHTRNASPPPSTVSPLTLKQIKTTVSEDICSDMAPRLQLIQNTLIEELKACDLHIYRQVWETFAPALKLTENIYCLVDNTSCDAVM
jgi:hypothetical protein